MRFVRASEDAEAFALEGSSFSRGVTEWAELRDFPVIEHRIAIVEDGVTAFVALSHLTAGMLVVRATSSTPVETSLSVEPRSWPQRLQPRSGEGGVTTDDAEFEQRWRVTASDLLEAQQLLDQECREALGNIGCWCRLSYVDGEIEVCVDDERLAGDHLLGAIELVLSLARAPAAPQPTTVYR